MLTTRLAVSAASTTMRCAHRARAAITHTAGAEQRHDDRERDQRVHDRSSSAAWAALGRLALEHELVLCSAGDVPVLDVVFDHVVVGHLPAAESEGEQERGDAERDHDRRQRERLRQRVGEVLPVAGADDRRDAAVTARDHEQEVGPVADEPDPDEDPRQPTLQEEERAGREQRRHGEGEQHAHWSTSRSVTGRFNGRLVPFRRIVGGLLVAEGLERHQHEADHHEGNPEVERQRARDLHVVEQRQVELLVAVLEDRATEQHGHQRGRGRDQHAEAEDDVWRAAGTTSEPHRPRGRRSATRSRAPIMRPADEPAAGTIVPGRQEVDAEHHDRRVEHRQRGVEQCHRTSTDRLDVERDVADGFERHSTISSNTGAERSDRRRPARARLDRADGRDEQDGDLAHRVPTAEVDEDHVDHVAALAERLGPLDHCRGGRRTFHVGARLARHDREHEDRRRRPRATPRCAAGGLAPAAAASTSAAGSGAPTRTARCSASRSRTG